MPVVNAQRCRKAFAHSDGRVCFRHWNNAGLMRCFALCSLLASPVLNAAEDALRNVAEAASHPDAVAVSTNGLRGSGPGTLLHLYDVASEGLSPDDVAFVFAWYGDAQRLAMFLHALSSQGRTPWKFRFGQKSLAFTVDGTARDWSLLHVAVVRNAPDVVRDLIAMGADVNDDAGLAGCPTPLELLLSRDTRAFGTRWENRQSFVDMALLLLKNGATATDRETLRSAVLIGDATLVDALIAAGADPNPSVTPFYNWLPLNTAVSMGLAAVVDVLLKHGADPESRDGLGFSAFDYAKYRSAIHERLVRERDLRRSRREGDRR